jgi:2-dehydro-3-deoxyphosphooctonate aldolase (KDO 8-P synthase)
VQLPGGAGTASAGQRQFVGSLSRAAAGAGIDGLFWEVHEDPDRALCDGPNSLPLDQVEAQLRQVLAIDAIFKEGLRS